MAFFGLTALGYQNTFASTSITSLNLHIFTINDYINSWKKILDTKEICNSNELQQIFRHLFHGPVPNYDAHILSEAFNGCFNDITFNDYITIIEQLREWAEKESENKNTISNNCDVITSSEFQESMRRHKRLPRSLQEKQNAPLTSTQEVSYIYYLFFFK